MYFPLLPPTIFGCAKTASLSEWANFWHLHSERVLFSLLYAILLLTTIGFFVVWYKDGLRFDCTGCGKCCTGPAGFVWVTLEEAEAMAAHLNMPLSIFKIRFIRIRQNRMCLVEKKNGDCIFLEGKKCSLYEVRPKQCKTYPWWPENLHSEESWKVAKASCEGIRDDAPLIPLSEICKNSGC